MSSRTLDAFLVGARRAVRHPVRSALNAITCAVAIAVTVNVISLSFGLEEDIRRDVSKFGRLTVDVGRAPLLLSGGVRAGFGPSEVAAIRAVVAGTGALVVPLRQERLSGRGDADAERLGLAAVGADYPRTLDVPLVAGRWFRDDEHGASACVLDESAAGALFPGRAPRDVVGRSVRLLGSLDRDVLIVGVLGDPMTYRALFEAFDEGRRSRMLTSTLLSFRNVYVPQDALPGGDLSLVHVRAPDEAHLDDVVARLTALWPRVDVSDPARGASPIRVFVRRDWMDAVGAVSHGGALLGNVVWMLVVGVAAVMITILNLLAIRERYDEIAVRRCEGARTRDVVLEVAGEGVVTSLAGGVLGLPIGLVGAAVLREMVDFPFRFDPRHVGAALGVSLLLGLLATVVPARRAARLDPARLLTRRVT